MMLARSRSRQSFSGITLSELFGRGWARACLPLGLIVSGGSRAILLPCETMTARSTTF